MSLRDPPARADRPGFWGPAGHAAFTGALAAAGAGAATAWGAPAAEVWTGAPLAWAIQAVAVWRLQRALGQGRAATRPWIAGMAGRLGGLGVVALVAGITGQDGAALALAYVATVIPLLWMEGLWLQRASAGAREREMDEPTDRRER